ncbi:hypothetical protein Vadar_013810 [Vaccinium darrowii]|uniref:Uncharacterized protein n=1 Tax=Vaccinium darrowii TaxID=229202 RepID=A0ACB7X128_9ERIC|nr:hypothetical protein Vadar_013810 [Vaccinium darrowii]
MVVITMSRTAGSKRKEGSVSTAKKTKKRKKDGKNIRKRWEESIPKRKGFTCEWQIEESSLEGTKLAELIKSQGLTHFFKLVKGYVVEWVMEFYKNMEIVEGETQRIKSKVGGKELTITLDHIAMYLEYQRPHWSKIGYPGNFKTTPESIRATLFVDYKNNHGSRGLKDNYRTMNKLLYCNLLPRGKEKVPQDEQVKFLYVFAVEWNTTIDFALWIYNELVKFRMEPKMQRNFPFPAMITHFCLEAGLKLSTTYKYKKGSGPIDTGTQNKSKSVIRCASEGITQSHKQIDDPTEAPSTSAPKQKGSQSKMMKILKSILCRQVEIQEDQKRINKKEELHHLTICKIAKKLGVEIDALDEGHSDSRAIGEHISPESSGPESSNGGVSLSAEDIDPGDV